MYPNGETAVWRPRKMPVEPPVPMRSDFEVGRARAILRWAIECPAVLRGAGLFMGLSILANFDKPLDPLYEGDIIEDEYEEMLAGGRTRSGLKGISRFGARMVRNGAYLIACRAPKERLTFATVTIPNLPYDLVARIHKAWPKVVELYRLSLSRELVRAGLPPDSVSVSEIQEKRYRSTGFPYLHIHTVFVGKLPYHDWAVSTERHDEIWKNALSAAIGQELPPLPAACQLKSVRKSAEAYLGKYMSKGGPVVREAVERGFGPLLPRQWWNMSRPLRREIDRQTVRPNDLAQFLFESATGSPGSVWKWFRSVEVESPAGGSVVVARYGRLTPDMVAQVRGAP